MWCFKLLIGVKNTTAGFSNNGVKITVVGYNSSTKSCRRRDKMSATDQDL